MEMSQETIDLLVNMQRQGYTHLYIDFGFEEIEFYESIDFNHPRSAYRKSCKLSGTPVEKIIEYMENNNIEDNECFAISDDEFLGSAEM